MRSSARPSGSMRKAKSSGSVMVGQLRASRSRLSLSLGCFSRSRWRHPAQPAWRWHGSIERRCCSEGRTGMPASHTLTASEREWLRVRSYLQEHRYDLAVEAAEEYPRDRRIAGTPLLGAAEWGPAAPIPLRSIDLTFQSANADHLATGAYVEETAELLPERQDGTRYLRYSDVVK